MRISCCILTVVCLLLTGCGNEVSEPPVRSDLQTAIGALDYKVLTKEDVSIHCGLEVILLPDKKYLARLSVKNQSSYPIYIPQRFVSFKHELYWDPFVILLDGEKVPYKGKIAARLPDSEDDYVIIEPAHALVSTLILNRYYDFDKYGSYSVKYEALADVAKQVKPVSSNGNVLLMLESNTVEFVSATKPLGEK